MATLYTPEPKTQGLDWLAGMVQNSQQLWQQERNLQQEAQRLQVAKQQQQAQTEQFWATQARLKDQEDFQNRKFLYDVADDTRKFEWNKVKDERNYGLDERRVATGENQEDRLTAGQRYSQDPNSLPNQFMEANTEAARARAEQDRMETARKGRDPWTGIPFSPDVEPPVKGETPQPWHAPMQLPPGQPTTGANLLPDIRTNKWRAPMQRPEEQPGISAANGQLTPNPNPPDGVWGPGKVPKSWRTGDVMNPVAGIDSLGNFYGIVVAGTSADGQKFYQRQTLPRPKPPVAKTDAEERNVDSDNLATLTKARRPIPKPPTPPLGATPEQIAAQNKAYGAQIKDVEEYNAPLNQQIYETTQRLNFRDSRERMKNTPLEKVEITEAFQNVAPLVMEAYSRRDPIALENLRVQVKPLADAGDPSAKRVLEYMDKIKGGKPAEKGLRTGGAYWNTP